MSAAIDVSAISCWGRRSVDDLRRCKLKLWIHVSIMDASQKDKHMMRLTKQEDYYYIALPELRDTMFRRVLRMRSTRKTY